MFPAISSDRSNEDISNLQLKGSTAPTSGQIISPSPRPTSVNDSGAAKPRAILPAKPILKHRKPDTGPGSSEECQPGPQRYYGDGNWYTNPMDSSYFPTNPSYHQVSVSVQISLKHFLAVTYHLNSSQELCSACFNKIAFPGFYCNLPRPRAQSAEWLLHAADPARSRPRLCLQVLLLRPAAAPRPRPAQDPAPIGVFWPRGLSGWRQVSEHGPPGHPAPAPAPAPGVLQVRL